MSTHSSEANYVQVGERAFWDAIKKLNVHPRPVGPYPYRSDFHTPDGNVMGRIVPADTRDGDPESYFLVRSLT